MFLNGTDEIRHKNELNSIFKKGHNENGFLKNQINILISIIYRQNNSFVFNSFQIYISKISNQ